MIDALFSALHGLLSVLGLTGADVATAGGVTGALALAVALVAAAMVLAAAVATTRTDSAGHRPPHPRRAIDISSPLPQSDPDAPGHPRPRAPQAAASAA